MRQLQEQGHKIDTWTPCPVLVPTRGWRLHKRHIPVLVVIWDTLSPLPWIYLSHGAYILPVSIYREGTLF